MFCNRISYVKTPPCSITEPFIHLWLYSSLLGPGRFFSFIILYTVHRTIWRGDQPIVRPLPTHRIAQIQNKRTQTPMPRVGLEPTIPVFQGAKTVHASDLAAAVMVALPNQMSLIAIESNTHYSVCVEFETELGAQLASPFTRFCT
jgi:hypothetical protein